MKTNKYLKHLSKIFLTSILLTVAGSIQSYAQDCPHITLGKLKSDFMHKNNFGAISISPNRKPTQYVKIEDGGCYTIKRKYFGSNLNIFFNHNASSTEVENSFLSVVVAKVFSKDKNFKYGVNARRVGSWKINNEPIEPVSRMRALKKKTVTDFLYAHESETVADLEALSFKIRGKDVLWHATEADSEEFSPDYSDFWTTDGIFPGSEKEINSNVILDNHLISFSTPVKNSKPRKHPFGIRVNHEIKKDIEKIIVSVRSPISTEVGGRFTIVVN